MATIYGSSSGRKKYTIGSQKGQDFVNNAKAGSTLTGADGSTWTKNRDGSTTIVQNGVSYTVGGASSGSASSKGSSGGVSSGGSYSGSSSGGASGSASGYTGSFRDYSSTPTGTWNPNAPKYTGGNAELDAYLALKSQEYFAAKANNDARGMADANNAANQARNYFGYAAENATADINNTIRNGSPTGTMSGSGGSSNGWTSGGTHQSVSVSSPSGYQSSSSSRPYATDDYGDTDYSVLLNDAMSSGANWQTVQRLLDQRNQKADQKGYNQYKYDSVWQSANNYINSAKNQEQIDQINAYYNQIATQQQAAQQAAVNQVVNQLSGQKGDIEQSYDDLYRQLYIDRRMAEKNLPQQLAAMGISGGLSESTLLGTQTAYTDALRHGEQEKLGALSDIDQAISDARLTGDINIANQAAQLAMNRLQSYSDLVNQLNDQNRWVTEFGANQQQNQIANEQWQQSFNRQQMLDQLSRDDVSYDRKIQIAQYLYENTGDASGFRALGFTDAQIAALENSYALAMQAMTASGNSGSSGNDANSAGYTGGGTYSDQTVVSTPTPFTDERFSMNNAWGNALLDSYVVNTIPDSVIRALSSLENGFSPSSNILSAIQNYYKQGVLTPAQVDYLLNQYGLS